VALTPLRVLVVADVSPLVVLGGGERVIWEQSRGLAARGHRVRVVSRLPEHGGAPAAAREGVEVRHFAVARRPAAAFVRDSILEARRAVLAEVRAHGADVVHFHQPFSAFGALTSGALRRLPSLYTFHSPAPLEYRGRQGTTRWHRRGVVGGAGVSLLAMLERWSLSRVTRIQVLSDYSAGLLRTLYGIAGERVVKIPGGVDPERFRPAEEPRDALRAALGWPADRRIVLTLRNLQPRMGLDELIRAVDRLRHRMPDVLLVIGGDGRLRTDLEALVNRLGLMEHVRFLGFVGEARLARCYQAADVFVLPTQALEGFGLVSVESLACGTPVLGTPVGATPEILGPLGRSLLFSGTTPAAMAGDLERFLEDGARDPAGADALRHACRLYAATRYSWAAAVDRLEQTLAVLAGPRAADDRCRVCGGRLGARFAFRTRRYRCCETCATAVLDAPPDRTRVRRLYDVEYPAAFGHARVAEARVRLFGSIAESLTRLRSPGRVLDVGCSGGHFLAEATGRGWRGLGSDLSHEACVVTRAGTRSPVAQADGAALPVRAGTVDAVALLGIVDLTTDPLATVREARRVLVPGGLLVIRVTNARLHRPLARLLGAAGWLSRFLPLGPVLHVFAFTEGGLATLAERAGFEIVEIRNSPAAAEAGQATGRERREATVLRAVVTAGAGVVAILSGGRCLIGPSIELYARRPRDGETRPP
jgi:glycosyltransferase involved in cell wall biosynthesis/SAM-dependent methyltransferase